MLPDWFDGRTCTWKYTCTCCRRWFLCLLLVASQLSGASESWPVPRLPDGLSLFALGEQLQLGDLPMRVHGFISPQPPDALLQAFRRSLGQPLVESVSAGKRILGRADGSFYVTVQVEAAGAGSRGMVAVTDLGSLERSVQDRRHGAGAATGNDARNWLGRFPAGSRMTSYMASGDVGKLARHVVVLNTHNSERNRDAVLSLLSAEGYRLERETSDHGGGGARDDPRFAGSRTLYFNAPGKEAVAVITPVGEQTAIVVNTVAAAQGAR